MKSRWMGFCTIQGMDVESIARDFGGRILFYGGIDVQQLLSFATPAEVRGEVHRNLRTFADCGGYVVANSHHCVETIQGELIEAMCQATPLRQRASQSLRRVLAVRRKSSSITPAEIFNTHNRNRRADAFAEVQQTCPVRDLPCRRHHGPR